jgi:hypothetical protein
MIFILAWYSDLWTTTSSYDDIQHVDFVLVWCEQGRYIRPMAKYT